MKKLRVEVTREDEYQIEIDKKVWTEEKLSDWSNTFSPVDSVEELAETLATEITRQGYDGFIEGFGFLKIYHSNGKQVTAFVHRGNLMPLPEDEYCQGIKVILKDYDQYYSTKTEEITEPEKPML